MDGCGFDDVIGYKSCGDLTAAIAEKYPNGVDICWENAGNALHLRFDGRNTGKLIVKIADDE